jgi:hypothetical protein
MRLTARARGISNEVHGCCSMSLLTRINLALGAVFVVAALAAGYVCRSILEANAQREVFAEAGLMMDSAAANADRLSLGDMSAEDFSGRGAKEIASLTRSFNRMRKSLEKALQLLEK